jgi:hypothetical protein
MAVRLSTLCAGSTLPPGRFLVLISVIGSVDPTARLEGLIQLKNSMTSSGIKPATFMLVAVPQSTTLPRSPIIYENTMQIP